MELIDEDPAQKRIRPSGQFCQKISGIVVLSGDVMQLDPLEFVLELAHLLAVCLHEGAFAGGLLHDLVNDQLRVIVDVESRTSSSMAMRSPLMRASYSVVLFEAEKWRWMA